VTAQPSFRLASESDADTLLGFMESYYAYDGHAFDRKKSRSALVRLLRDANLGLAWLILDGETATGYIVICFGYSLEWLGRDAFVDEFYLTERYRGRGWGRRTIEFVEDATRKLGVTALHLEVVQQNRTALQVYSRLDFTEHTGTFMSKWIAREFAKPG
jgi:diamine N-acetyltransferase